MKGIDIMLKQNSELQSAINDISVIKQTLEKAKVHFCKLSNLFIIFGGTQLLVYIFQLIGRFLCIKNGFLQGIEVIHYTKYITLAILFVFFLKMRKDIKEHNNIYTLQLFDIWGIILFAVPLIRFVVSFIQFILYGTGFIQGVAIFAYACTDLIEYTSVITGVLVTGCILNKKLFIIGGYGLLCACPLFFFVGADNVNVDTIMAAYGHCCNASASIYIITLILYIIIGIIFKIFNGGGKIGVE